MSPEIWYATVIITRSRKFYTKANPQQIMFFQLWLGCNTVIALGSFVYYSRWNRCSMPDSLSPLFLTHLTEINPAVSILWWRSIYSIQLWREKQIGMSCNRTPVSFSMTWIVSAPLCIPDIFPGQHFLLSLIRSHSSYLQIGSSKAVTSESSSRGLLN